MALPGALHAPVALTPRRLEQARAVEYQRALVAEAAMQSGPAISRHDILFEDEWLLLVNKPSGIYSGHVLASAPSVMDSADSSQLHLANRLDRDTSGVLIISKAKEISRKLGQLFTKRKMAKCYFGLCTGCLPKWRAITVTSGHGRSEFGVYNVFPVSDIGKKLVGRGGSVVKEMKTRFVISTITRGAENSDTARAQQEISQGFAQMPKEMFHDRAEHDCKSKGVLTGPPEGVSQQGHDHDEQELVVTGPRIFQDSFHLGDAYSGFGDTSVYEVGALPESRKFLFTAFPLTGRTHQIRLQCLYLGIPLLGDVKYGGPHCTEGITNNAHCLHAGSLSFKHPETSADLHVVAPLPPWARAAIQV